MLPARIKFPWRSPRIQHLYFPRAGNIHNSGRLQFQEIIYRSNCHPAPRYYLAAKLVAVGVPFKGVYRELEGSLVPLSA